MDDRPEIAKRTEARRETLELNRHELSRRMKAIDPSGPKPQSLEKLEKGGIRKPRFLNLLARVLETTPEWLVGEGDIHHPPPPRSASSLDSALLVVAISEADRAIAAGKREVTRQERAELIVGIYEELLRERGA